ncbi:GGDEF domain-containing protein [Microvirga subterranea]|nr:GGDEF domain-containing protein [Microvirga subterranea]
MTLAIVAVSQIVSFSIRYSSGQPFTWFVFMMNSILPTLTALPGSLYIFRQNARLQKALDDMTVLHKEVSRRATIDAMTGLLNRETFLTQLREIRRSAPDGVLLLIDADNFKAINDQYGHAAGDLALMIISDRLRHADSTSYLTGRIGGEEFAVYLPDTSMERGVEIAEQYRIQIERAEFKPDGEVRHRLTVSIGAAPVRPGTKVSDVMREADQNLYEAKSKGRNRTVSPLDHSPLRKRPNLVVIPGGSGRESNV